MPKTFPAAELERALGSAPVDRARVTRGYAGNDRWRVRLADGRRVFVKQAPNELRAGWLREEHAVYSTVHGSFLPELHAWLDGGGTTALVLEDLGDCHWPPPWRPGDVEAVLSALSEIAATTPPPDLPNPEGRVAHNPSWRGLAADPAPFLALGLCSRSWLESTLPALEQAAAAAPLQGVALLHLDVRSDNVCLRDGRALLVDWNWASVGNPDVDLACWLPSLHLEGGPAPEAMLPEAGGLAAWLTGIWSASAGLPPPPGADPALRRLQAEQAGVAMRWAATALGLPSPDPLGGSL